VKKGDTLGAICSKLGVSMDVISAANDINDVNTIYPGQKLWIPRTYTIQKGDTLFRIAQQHQTTVGDLLKLNNFSNPDEISAGDVLLLPS